MLFKRGFTLTGASVNLSDLENLHKGETVWVLGSGPSLDFIDPGFFDDKTVVTTNFVGKTYGIKKHYGYSNYHLYNVDHYEKDPELIFGPGLITAVLLKHDTLTRKPWEGEVPEKIVFSEASNYAPPGSQWDPYKMPPPPGQIVYGSSGIHGATHLAAHLGASHIVLVGSDAGTIDEKVNVSNYPTPTESFSLGVWNRHSIILKRWLQERYGVNIYSLNPFINLNLEGHTFKGVS